MAEAGWGLVLALGYWVLLFVLALRVERQGKGSWLRSPYVYALSLAVYCSAWTFYGSIGRASTFGLSYLPIYLGPTIGAMLFPLLLRRMILLCKHYQIGSLADLLSSRYGKSVAVGSVVTLISLFGIVPYISLQLKAVSESFGLLMLESPYGAAVKPAYEDTAFYVALILLIFTLLFGTRRSNTLDGNPGLVSAVVVDSVVKLIAFLVVGAVVTFSMYNGPTDILEQASRHVDLRQLFEFNSSLRKEDWFWIGLLAMGALFVLPRQFQVAVVENTQVSHVDKAMWLFPLYLLLINVFVTPLTLAGIDHFGGGNFSSDYFILELPMSGGFSPIVLLVFLGGFAAATGMVIVETTALGNMAANNLVLPLLLKAGWPSNDRERTLTKWALFIRRMAIAVIIITAYLYYRNISYWSSLVSIGLISFVSVIQFLPALIGGLFWKQASRKGALAGMIAGFLIWTYTLILPSLASRGIIDQAWLAEGPWGFSWLKPDALFGLTGYSAISHSLIWSLTFNLLLFVGISLFSEQSLEERNQAKLFVDVQDYLKQQLNPNEWQGNASVAEVRTLLQNFMGSEKAAQALNVFARRNQLDLEHNQFADSRLLAFAERILAGTLGSASARILLESVTKEQEIGLTEVMGILKESQQVIALNKELVKKSAELSKARDELSRINEQLKIQDEVRNDFLSTVTHEIRTPITSIRALSEILYDNPDLEEADRQHYLHVIIRDTERLSRLISQVLDLERYDSGRQKLSLSQVTWENLTDECASSLRGLQNDKQVKLDIVLAKELPPLIADADKVVQLLINLLANALKFVPELSGVIRLEVSVSHRDFVVKVTDNGPGIPEEFQQLIFEKFFQTGGQGLKKPVGSGLGLAICQRIVQLHGGQIKVESLPGQGACFCFTLPILETVIVQ